MFPEDGVESLAVRFQARSLSRAEWTHEAHLAVGLWHVARFGPRDAVELLRVGIRALNEANGVANTATGGYHETITQAYVKLIARFLERRGLAIPTQESVQDHVTALLADPLAERAALLSWWSAARLMSPSARGAWIEPDLAPLP